MIPVPDNRMEFDNDLLFGLSELTVFEVWTEVVSPS